MGKDEAVGGPALASQVKVRSGQVEVMSGTYQVRKLLFWPTRYQVSLGQIRSCYSQPGTGKLWSRSGLVRYKSGHVRSGLALAGLGGRGMEVRL